MTNSTNQDKHPALCVYCASSPEVDQKYKDAAYEVGRLCAANGWHLIYGGGAEGLMGAVCDGCQDAGGTVTGIIPHFMVERGWLRPGIDEVIAVDTMAQRKQLFRDKCDAILVLPGGFGTMEEFYETVTARQIHIFDKPIVVLNQDGYYDLLEQWKMLCHKERFARNKSDISLWTTIQQTEQLFPLLSSLL